MSVDNFTDKFVNKCGFIAQQPGSKTLLREPITV